MKIYNYSGETGEFLIESNARKDPKEKDKYLLPAYATFEAPPSVSGNQVAIFESGAWSILPDYRGTVVEVLGAEKTITEIGVTPDDLAPTQEQIDEYDAAQQAAIRKHIAMYREQVETSGIEVDGVLVQTDVASRSNLLGARDLGTSINWKTPNGFVTLTPEQIDGIAVLVGTHVQKCFNAEMTVEAAHDATPYESKEAVEVAFNAAYAA